MMDLDQLIECLVANDKLDDTFGLKEECPECHTTLVKTNDGAFPYYCPNCELLINKNKTEGKKKTL